MTKEGTMAQVFVKDTGIGMKEETKAKLFRID
jgi:signal transduction histidine kinase